MNLKNLKNVKLTQPSPQTQLEIQLGFTIGILIGAIGAGVLVLFFTTWEWYFKVISAIGSIGIIGSLTLAIFQIWNQRKNYLEALNMMKETKIESDKIIEEKTNEFKEEIKELMEEKWE